MGHAVIATERSMACGIKELFRNGREGTESQRLSVSWPINEPPRPQGGEVHG